LDLTSALLASGHTIPTAHLADPSTVTAEAEIGAREVFTRDINWIRRCDVLIAEVSTPSHGVGYEIGFALGEGKPVLCLYQEGRKVTKMIVGNPDPNLKVRPYGTVEEAISMAIKFLKRG
jgi:2'-deoxynucleoside 5'-phosphate N-hydrolase